MNDFDRFAITVRLAAAEQEGILRAERPDEEAHRRREGANWLDKIVVLVVIALLATPFVFLILRSF